MSGTGTIENSVGRALEPSQLKGTIAKLRLQAAAVEGETGMAIPVDPPDFPT